MAGKADGPLPPLSGLDCSKLSPEAKRQKAPGGAGAAPGTGWKVTQAEAKEWFEAKDAEEIGSGAYGETRKFLLPCGRWVVIKKFTDPHPPEAREEGEAECAAHLAMWQRSDQDCRQYMSEPAEMEFETEESEGTYAVQSLIQAGRMTLAKLSALRDKDRASDRRILPQIAFEDKEKICKAYGAMRACIAKAGVLHKDLHTGNVLCVTNYPMDDAQLPQYLDNGVLKDEKKHAIEIQWRVVDWGVAVTFDRKNPEDDDKEICWVPKYEYHTEPTDDAKIGVKNKTNECMTEKIDFIIRELYRILYFERWGPEGTDRDCSKAGTRSECVTPSDVYGWVREGFADALGKTVPDELEKATEKRAQEHLKRLGFQDGGGASV